MIMKGRLKKNSIFCDFFRFFATEGSKKSKKVAKKYEILNEIDMKTQNRALSKFQILTELSLQSTWHQTTAPR